MHHESIAMHHESNAMHHERTAIHHESTAMHHESTAMRVHSEHATKQSSLTITSKVTHIEAQHRKRDPTPFISPTKLITAMRELVSSALRGRLNRLDAFSSGEQT